MAKKKSGKPFHWICPACLILLWQAFCSWGLIPADRLVSPLDVIRGLYELEPEGLPPGYVLHLHIFYSLKLVAAGFLSALVLALPLGVLIGGSHAARAVLGPFFEFLRPVPPLAWIPLSMLWFGIGFPSACFIIFLGSFFPILVNTISGVLNAPVGLVGAAEVLGANKRQIWFKVLLPAALPSALTGVRLGMSVAWMTLVAAEFTGTQDGYGLGYMIMTARDLQRLDLIIAGMVVIGIIGIFLERLLCYTSRRLLHRV